MELVAQSVQLKPVSLTYQVEAIRQELQVHDSSMCVLKPSLRRQGGQQPVGHGVQEKHCSCSTCANSCQHTMLQSSVLYPMWPVRLSPGPPAVVPHASTLPSGLNATAFTVRPEVGFRVQGWRGS